MQISYLRKGWWLQSFPRIAAWHQGNSWGFPCRARLTEHAAKSCKTNKQSTPKPNVFNDSPRYSWLIAFPMTHLICSQRWCSPQQQPAGHTTMHNGNTGSLLLGLGASLDQFLCCTCCLCQAESNVKHFPVFWFRKQQWYNDVQCLKAASCIQRHPWSNVFCNWRQCPRVEEVRTIESKLKDKWLARFDKYLGYTRLSIWRQNWHFPWRLEQTRLRCKDNLTLRAQKLSYAKEAKAECSDTQETSTRRPAQHMSKLYRKFHQRTETPLYWMCRSRYTKLIYINCINDGKWV